MIPRRLYGHIRQHNWFAVAIDFLIVVVGVFVGVQVSNWNDASKDSRRTDHVIETLRADLRNSVGVEERFIAEIGAGLAAFDAARARGEKPVPFVFRIAGSDTPPSYVWQAALQSRLADLIHPTLLFDLGFFYSERDGLGVRYLRYATFVESEILPRAKVGAAAFYDESGALKPEFAANLDRLRELRSFHQFSVAAAKCLERRFVTPAKPGESCRSDYQSAPGGDAT